MFPFSPPMTLQPPPPPPIRQPEAAQIGGDERVQHYKDLSPSILIVTGIIALVIITSVLIHLFLKFLSHRHHHRHHHRHSFSSSSSSSPVVDDQRRSISRESASSEQDQKTVLDSLPLLTLASSLPKSSPDCAVCLSKFEPQDQLRLLPACRHVFHSTCIDTWIKSTPSCPLCRSSISTVFVPTFNSRSGRSESFRVEIGNVSRRREGTAALESSFGVGNRSYSLGSSFEYVVEEEEIEAVVSAVAAHVRINSKDNEPTSSVPTATEELTAEIGNRSGRWWLKEYMDRLTISASSSMRFSGRWSRRSESIGTGSNVFPDVGNWDLEGGNAINGSSGRVGDDMAMFLSLYSWISGV
ncbi:putative Ring finger protein [Zostera marina]|uniref:Putative Ring finger protein n=1 Tax=Zostera marina TaxID=29655 RepID=A0A0K9P4D6_ZOSMR|nr:putative Ring finger protein [Zostera marina]